MRPDPTTRSSVPRSALVNALRTAGLISSDALSLGIRTGALWGLPGRAGPRESASLLPGADAACRSSGCDRGRGTSRSCGASRRASGPRTLRPAFRCRPAGAQAPRASCTSKRRCAAVRRARRAPALAPLAPHRSVRPKRKCPALARAAAASAARGRLQRDRHGRCTRAALKSGPHTGTPGMARTESW